MYEDNLMPILLVVRLQPGTPRLSTKQSPSITLPFAGRGTLGPAYNEFGYNMHQA